MEAAADAVNAILDDLRTDVDFIEETRDATGSALAEVPSLLASLAAITSCDSLVKGAIEGSIDGLEL